MQGLCSSVLAVFTFVICFRRFIALQYSMSCDYGTVDPAVITFLGNQAYVEVKRPVEGRALLVTVGVDEVTKRRDLVATAPNQILIEIELAPVAGVDIVHRYRILLGGAFIVGNQILARILILS